MNASSEVSRSTTSRAGSYMAAIPSFAPNPAAFATVASSCSSGRTSRYISSNLATVSARVATISSCGSSSTRSTVPTREQQLIDEIEQLKIKLGACQIELSACQKQSSSVHVKSSTLANSHDPIPATSATSAWDGNED